MAAPGFLKPGPNGFTFGGPPWGFRRGATFSCISTGALFLKIWGRSPSVSEDQQVSHFFLGRGTPPRGPNFIVNSNKGRPPRGLPQEGRNPSRLRGKKAGAPQRRFNTTTTFPQGGSIFPNLKFAAAGYPVFSWAAPKRCQLWRALLHRHNTGFCCLDTSTACRIYPRRGELFNFFRVKPF